MSERSFVVKISKVSVIVLLLLIGVMVLEVNYFKKKTDNSEMKAEEEKSPEKPEENLTKLREEEDQKIIHIVDLFQKGYSDGCNENREIIKSNPAGTQIERSYLLGFEKGEKVCAAQREKKKQEANYKRGEEDGCSTAKGKPVQNKDLYLKKGMYQKGWDKGYKGCKKPEPVKSPKEKEVKPPQSRINRQSPEYQKGYRNGCDADMGSYFRDEALYLHSKAYRAGWTEGRKKCRSRRGETEPERVTKPSPQRYFDQGYRDGCDSAEGYFRRDRYKYGEYRSYREGWNQGRKECERVEMEQRLPPPPMIFQPFGY